MNREDVIRMARESDLIRVVAKHDDGTVTAEVPNILNIKRFAALIAATEREACAKFAAEYMEKHEGAHFGIADAIRARGQG
jgi:hypothetical protein